MSERPTFRPETQRPPQRSAGPLLAALFVAIAVALVAQWVIAAQGPTGRLVTVAGDVPNPGTHLVESLTVHAAVQAAGGDVSSLVDAPVPEGFVVEVVDGIAKVLPPREPLLVGLPVDVNKAPLHQFMAIPGLGQRLAGAIVAHREDHGTFRNLDELTAVPGMGPSTLKRLRPFLNVENPIPTPPKEPVDINHASAAELKRLPGIGEVTAARIIVDRAENGPFASLDALQRVSGIGPALVEGLGERAVANP